MRPNATLLSKILFNVQVFFRNGDSISPLAADDGGKRKRRKKRKKRSMIQSSEEAGVEAANKSEEDEQLFAGNTSEDKLLDLSQKQRRISDSSEEKLR